MNEYVRHEGKRNAKTGHENITAGQAGDEIVGDSAHALLRHHYAADDQIPADCNEYNGTVEKADDDLGIVGHQFQTSFYSAESFSVFVFSTGAEIEVRGRITVVSGVIVAVDRAINQDDFHCSGCCVSLSH